MPNATKSQATPGPWRVGDAGATVFGPPNGNPSPETIASVRRKANARLIAAAPQLRDAVLVFILCPATVAWLEANDPMALQQARKAIEAAGGES